MVLLASLRAMVFCCFVSACQEVILDLCFQGSEGNVRLEQIEECSIFPFFSRDSDVTLGTFAMHFGRCFGTKLGGVLLFRKRLSGAVAWSFQRRCLRPSGPWCFAVSQVPVKRSFWTCVSKAQKVTFNTAACGLELPMALLASLRAMVLCCFASACQELWPGASNGAACVPQGHGVLLFRKRLSRGHFGLVFPRLRR